MKRTFQAALFLALFLSLVLALAPALFPSSALSWDGLITAQADQKKTLIMPVLYATEIPQDMELIEHAVSELTQREIGVSVELIPVLYSTAASGQDELRRSELELLEKQGITFDILPSLIQNGSFLPLDDLLETYGQEIVRLVGERRLDLMRQDGVLYELPSVSDYISSFGLTMRKDIVERYDLDLSSLKTLEDLDELFDYVSSQEPELYMISGYRTRNGFVSRLKAAKIDIPPFCSQSAEDPGNLKNYYASQEYGQMVSLFYDWNQAGYIPDHLFLQSIEASSLVKGGILFSYFSPYKPNIEYEETLSCGREMVSIPLMEPMVTSSSIDITVHWGINSTCQEPEKAMELLNLLYTNESLANLLSYGIENIHYRVLEDGSITYPDGVTADTCGYQNTQTWLLPNQYLSLVWEGNDPGLWEEVKEYNESADYSDTIAFSPDTSGLSRELAKIDEILGTYATGLESGQLDPDVYLPMMLDEMEAAGADTVLAEMQAQFDRWK